MAGIYAREAIGPTLVRHLQQTWLRREGDRDAQVVAADHGVPGHVHAAGRRHDRERRPAGHGGRPQDRVRLAAVGRRRLRPGVGGTRPRDGVDRRPDRAPPCLRRRPGAVRGGVVRLRHRAQLRRADRRPHRAGRRRRRDVRDDLRAAQQQLPGPRPRHGLRHVGRGERRVGGDRADRRRPAHRGHLAGGGSSS